MKVTASVALLSLCVSFASAANTPNNLPAPDVEKLMSAAEFRQAGLAKLTPEELAALNAWLGKYTFTLASAFAEKAIVGEAPPATPEAVESYIEGDFEGWDGETIFKLDNGQIWQQANYAYMYHYAYHPKVLIFRSGGVYKMQVQGVSQTIAVKRLK